MTQTDYNEIYTSVFKAYEQLNRDGEDEYIKESLGDILDHMILLRKHNLLAD